MEFNTKKRFKAAPEDLFRDFSNYAKLQSWFVKDKHTSRTQINADFAPGGKFHFETISDIGDVSHFFGEYTSIYQNRHIDMVWNDGEVRDTLVTLDFVKNERAGTTLILTHANLPDKKTLEHHRELWKTCLESLSDYVNKD